MPHRSIEFGMRTQVFHHNKSLLLNDCLLNGYNPHLQFLEVQSSTWYYATLSFTHLLTAFGMHHHCSILQQVEYKQNIKNHELDIENNMYLQLMNN
jgi:hypothetical protein